MPMIVTIQDLERLRSLTEIYSSGADSRAADELDAELDLATIVSDERLPPNVVTMGSRVLFEDEGTGRRREIVLVEPQDSDPARGRISVLAPAGMALLGLRAGDSIDWPGPEGRTLALRVIAVLHQPESVARETELREEREQHDDIEEHGERRRAHREHDRVVAAHGASSAVAPTEH
jgi:regulator of nucleoside diphosphate kinase